MLTASQPALSAPSPTHLPIDSQRLDTLLTELRRSAPEMHDRILMDGYRDLFLSDNFLFLMQEAERDVTDTRDRLLYRKLTDTALQLLADVGSLVSG